MRLQLSEWTVQLVGESKKLYLVSEFTGQLVAIVIIMIIFHDTYSSNVDCVSSSLTVQISFYNYYYFLQQVKNRVKFGISKASLNVSELHT